MKAELLENFGAAMADRPLDMDKVSSLREKILIAGGEELLVESGTIVGQFSMVTKCVDATGRLAPPGMLEKTVNALKTGEFYTVEGGFKQ